MTKPASDGPTRRAILTMEEFSAMALPRSCLSSTISTRKAWRPGMSKALMVPCSALSQMISVNVDVMAEGENGKREGLQHCQDLRYEQNLAAIEAIHPHSGDGREKEGGDLSREADDAEQERRAGEAIDEPASGEARHPCAHQGDGLSGEVEAEISVAQRAPGVRDAGVLGWRRICGKGRGAHRILFCHSCRGWRGAKFGEARIRHDDCAEGPVICAVAKRRDWPASYVRQSGAASLSEVHKPSVDQSLDDRKNNRGRNSEHEHSICCFERSE